MRQLIIICLLLFGGCSSAIFGPISAVSGVVNATILWKSGEATAYYPYDREVLHKATIRALKKLNLAVTQNTATDKNISMIATSKDRFKITITQSEKNISKIAIRVNTWGDRDYALLIYANIEDQLNVVVFP